MEAYLAEERHGETAPEALSAQVEERERSIAAREEEVAAARALAGKVMAQAQARAQAADDKERHVEQMARKAKEESQRRLEERQRVLEEWEARLHDMQKELRDSKRAVAERDAALAGVSFVSCALCCVCACGFSRSTWVEGVRPIASPRCGRVRTPSVAFSSLLCVKGHPCPRQVRRTP